MTPSRPSSRGVCVLASGGVESAALIAHFLKEGAAVHPVYVRGGYRWEKAELDHLRRLLAAMARPGLEALTVLDVSTRAMEGPERWAFSGQVPGARSADEEVYLSGRNLLLISMAAVFCANKGIGTVAVGILRSNPFRDARPAFLSRLERALAACFGRPLRVSVPLRRFKKKQVIRRYADVPWELTFSCIAPAGRRPCGRCNKCEERRRAVVDSGRIIPSRFFALV